MDLAEPRRCQAVVTELARPAAAPPTAAAPEENPLLAEEPLLDEGVPVPLAGGADGDAG
jgi:hypothetical protein